jgi:hypothetical protein
VVVLDDDDPEIVELALNSFYRSTYAPQKTTGVRQYVSPYPSQPNTTGQKQAVEPVEDHTLQTHLKVFILADKWDIPPLRQEALSEYSSGLDRNPTSNQFIDSLRIIFDEDEGFPRDVSEGDSKHVDLTTTVLQHAAKHYMDLVENPAFQELLSSVVI